MNLSKYLNQTALYWAPLEDGKDAYGVQSFYDYVEVPVRLVESEIAQRTPKTENVPYRVDILSVAKMVLGSRVALKSASVVGFDPDDFRAALVVSCIPFVDRSGAIIGWTIGTESSFLLGGL